jgi:uncharacterized protein involved in outer membrane biogenesis
LPRRSKRSLLLALLAVAGLLLAGAISLLLYDFQAHQERLTEQLAHQLGRPVQIGQVTLSLRHGPALSFAAVKIGADGDDEFYLQAERFLLRIKWSSLWQGHLHFAEIVLESPFVQISSRPQHAGEDSAANLLQGFARAVQVDQLTVRNGRLRLLWPQIDAPPAALEVRHLHASFQQLSGATPIALQFSGQLLQQGGNAIVQGHGQLHPAADWADARVELELLARQLRIGDFLAETALGDALPQSSGTVDLQLRAHGSAAEGMRLDLTGNASALAIILTDGRQLPLSKWRAEGRWQATASHHALDDLRLSLDDLDFTGALRIAKSGPDPKVTGRVSSSPLPLARLAPFWPPSTSSPWLDTLRTADAGLLQFEAHFAGGPKTLTLTELQLALWDGACLLPEGRALTGLSLLATLARDGSGQFEGEALLQDLPFSFSGALANWAEQPWQIEAEAQGSWPAEQLLAQLPQTGLADGFRATGQLPWQLSVQKTGEGAQLELQAELQQVALQHGDLAMKRAGQPGRLLASGIITGQQYLLRQARLQLPLLELQAQGSLQRQPPQQFELVVETVANLSNLQSTGGWLGRLQPTGGVDLHYRLSGAEGHIRQRGGTLQLRRVGLRPGTVAELKEISGKVRLFEDRAESVGALRGKIGTSAAQATARLHNFEQPVLELQVEAKSIRANELIFPSEEMLLRNVHGGLRISAAGLDFQGIQVQLDGGTKAVVDGSLRNYAEPALELQVAASYGNIDEVIALWQRPAAPPKRASRETARGTYRIQARVEQGQLGQLHFEEAVGTITLPEGDLLVYPLQFQVGPGRGLGHVLLTHHGEAASLLRVSGTVENFDAAAIYNQLLKRRGLVSGKLRGDFYLQGEPGKNFLASSSGGIDLEVRQGVLRKFRFISKVFSILNVSQILSFRLPDMADEGMPFDRLHATFRLQEGVLSTENLLIDSNAMNLSLIGDIDLQQERLDLLLGVKPLRTVDRIITRIPVAGWLLTGEAKALITAHFQIRGNSDDPEVMPVTITSLPEKVIGIFSRILGLPGKLIDDMGSLLEGGDSGGK